MRISSRFTIAIHICACIATFENEYKITSEFLASSVNVNPVVIRKILSQLKSADIVNVKRGSGGTALSKKLCEITFLDIYNAVDCIENGELFHFHENPNPLCPVGRNIRGVLNGKLTQIQNALESEMSRITLSDVVNDIRFNLAKE